MNFNGFHKKALGASQHVLYWEMEEVVDTGTAGLRKRKRPLGSGLDSMLGTVPERTQEDNALSHI